MPYISRVEPFFGRILELVAGGSSAQQAVKAIPGCPGYSTVMGWINSNPERRKRMADAIPPKIIWRDYFDVIFKSIEGGLRLKEACEANPAGRNTYENFLFWLQRHPDAYERLRALLLRVHGATRPRGGKKGIAPARWEASLAAVADGTLFGKIKPPRLQVMKGRAKRDQQFAQRLDQALAARATVFRSRDVRNREIQERDEARRRRMLTGGLLKASLNSNDLYCDASRAISKTIEPDLREDLISEVILAVLSGNLQRANVQADGKAFATRQMNNRRYLSLDTMSLFANTSEKTITSDVWHYEDAA